VYISRFNIIFKEGFLSYNVVPKIFKCSHLFERKKQEFTVILVLL